MNINNGEVAISIRNLCKTFEDNIIFDNLNLDIPYGKTTCIMGQTGHGKSVLSRIITRARDDTYFPDSGEIYIRRGDGKMIDILKLSYDDFTRQYLATDILGIVLQSKDSLWTFERSTVYENVALIPRERGRRKSEIEQIVRETLQKVGLDYEHYKDMHVRSLSLGEAKRVLLARALAPNHKIIIYDEPTTSAEPEILTTLTNLIKEIHERTNNTSIVISHDIDSVKVLAKGGKVVLLRKKRKTEPARIIFEGNYDEFEKIPGDYFKLFRMELEGGERDRALGKEGILGSGEGSLIESL